MMQIAYIATNYESNRDSRLLAKWLADPAIRHFAIPQRDEENYLNPDSPEKIQAQGREKGHFNAADLMILADQIPVGHCDLQIDPPQRITKTGKVAWIGITIGESDYRGKGIGKKTIQHLESLARELGATFVEVGVFEFNEASLRLFRGLGYQEIDRLENFTYWNQKQWADIRFLKKLA